MARRAGSLPGWQPSERTQCKGVPVQVAEAVVPVKPGGLHVPLQTLPALLAPAQLLVNCAPSNSVPSGGDEHPASTQANSQSTRALAFVGQQRACSTLACHQQEQPVTQPVLGQFPVTAFNVAYMMTHLAHSQQCTPRRKLCCCKLHWLCRRGQHRTIHHKPRPPCCGQHSCLQTLCWPAQWGLMSTLREGTGTSQ